MASNPIKIAFKKTSEPDVTQVKNVWVKKWITWVKNVENWLCSSKSTSVTPPQWAGGLRQWNQPVRGFLEGDSEGVTEFVFFSFFFLFHRILARRGDPIGGVQWSLNQSRPSTTPLVRADGRPIRIRCHQNGGLPLKTDLREPANVVALDEFPLSKVLTEESFHLERFVETNDYRQRSRNPFRVERSRSSWGLDLVWRPLLFCFSIRRSHYE